MNTIKILRSYVDNDAYCYYMVDDIHHYWVSVTPAILSWEFEQDGDEDTYLTGKYVLDSNSVVDYDGVFELPAAVIVALRSYGYKIDL